MTRLLALVVAGLLACLAIANGENGPAAAAAHRTTPPDGDLARAIAASAYTIVDLKTGRTVREQRGEWLDAPIWPGSIAKLATFAAAIDAHTLTDTTRIVCTRRVTLPGGRRVDCTHPPLGRGLSVVDAIAQSCNAFAAAVARTITREQLAHGFVAMGLQPPPASADPVASALGLEGTKVAPRRLIEPVRRTFAAGGGVGGAAAGGDGARARDTIPMRRLLREGLRESARGGTASAFGRAGIDALAKTGTAPMPNGRSLGLVTAAAPADAPRYAIVLALPGGIGAQAAETAAALIGPLLGNPSQQPADAAPWAAPAIASTVRVGQPTSTGYAIETIPIEDYVARVVAGESSSSTPIAAREALAITARTYAMVNRDRHRADGFDLCTLTHCQVTRPASTASRAAAERTRGQVLARDGRPVPVFYSASCGGTLVDPRALLPDVDPRSVPWMTARPDPAGVNERTWQSEISARELLAALRKAGLRGDQLRHLAVRAGANGIVTQVIVDGLTPSTLSADEFRRAIGQHLGWQYLKSTRFTAERTAAGYRFSGRGHGHGVGLCVLGASALAARGYDTARLLQTYFPGLQVWPPPAVKTTTAAKPTTVAPPATTTPVVSAPPASPPASAPSGTKIQLRLPEADEHERDRLKRLVDGGLRDLSTRLAIAPPSELLVVVHPTADSYRRATGRPWFTAAATILKGGEFALHLVPLATLERAGQLELTVRHELVHVLTVQALADRPRWVHEGLALHFAGERVTVDPVGTTRRKLTCPKDGELMRPRGRDAFEEAYARAAACVERDLTAGRSWRDLGAR